MKKTIIIAAAALVSMAACKNSKYPGYEDAGNGAYFKIDKENKNGKVIHAGDVVFMSHTMTTEKDSVLYSYKTMLQPGQPYAVRITAPVYKGDMFEMMLKMRTGDSASFMLRIDSMFDKYYHQAPPKFLDPKSFIIYHVRIDSMIPSAKVDSIQKEGQRKQMVMMENAKNMEDSLIHKYLADNKITEKPTASGLYMVVKQKGKGPNVKKGDNVEVKYTGMLTNGQVFDASDKHDKAFSFNAGEGQVIPAWDEALLNMNVGEKALIVAPSKIAYGERGSGPIPPFAPLVFEMEVVKINAPAK